MARRLDLGRERIDIVGGCWWGKRKREPFLLGLTVTDPTDPPRDLSRYSANVWKHIGEGVLLSEGVAHRTFQQRLLAVRPGEEFRYSGINVRMTDDDIAAQLPELRYREGVESVREAVREERWDNAEKILLLLNEETPEYLHHLEREHWLTLYEKRPALRALNMGFV